MSALRPGDGAAVAAGTTGEAVDGAPGSESVGGAGVRSALLAARDARQARLDSFLARSGGSGCVVAVSTVIPGADKRLPGTELIVGAALAQIRASGRADGSRDRVTSPQADFTNSPATMFVAREDHGEDILDEYAFFNESVDARCMKERCVALESTLPWGRLLDLDVYDAGGRAVTRQALGLPQRMCLVCDEAARDCMRLGRHSDAELRDRVTALLRLLHKAGRLAGALAFRPGTGALAGPA
jgi:holo-ACP synthase